MKSLKEQCSLLDCKFLKELILRNPDLPMLVFADTGISDDCGYIQVGCRTPYIDYLTLYNNFWLNKDEYEEELRCNLLGEKYDNLTDEEFDKEIRNIIEHTEFVKAIVLHTGE